MKLSSDTPLPDDEPLLPMMYTVEGADVEFRALWVHVQEEIDDVAALGVYLVLATLGPLACGIGVVPIDLVTGAVVALWQILGDGEGRQDHPCAVGVAEVLSQTVLSIEIGVRQQFAAHVGLTVLGDVGSELPIVVEVHIEVSVHGAARVAGRCGNLVARHHRHLRVEHLSVHAVARLVDRHLRGSTLCGHHGEAFEAIVALALQLLVEVERVVALSLL